MTKEEFISQLAKIYRTYSDAVANPRTNSPSQQDSIKEDAWKIISRYFGAC